MSVSQDHAVQEQKIRAVQRRGKKTLNTILLYVFLILVFLFSVFPFLWTLAISLTDKTVVGGTSIYNFPASLFPTRLSLQNFVQVYNSVGIPHAFWNSVVISTLTVVGTLLISALAAYPLARMEFPGRNIIFTAIIATLILPTETAFIVNTMTLKNLANLPIIGGNNCFLNDGPMSFLAPYVCQGLRTYWSVVLPTVATGFGIFLMRQSYLAIPQALIEASRIDGATETQILWKIMVPLSMPALTALAIFTLVNTWNAFVWPKIALLGAQDLEPMSIAVLKLKGYFTSDPFNIAAGAVIMMLPILIIFFFSQKLFLRGLDGAVK